MSRCCRWKKRQHKNSGQKHQLIPAENGGPFETVLGPGLYVAGIQIPAGFYYGELVSGSGSVCVWNDENSYWESSYLYEDGGKDSRIMKELELSAGTVLKIMDEAQLAISAKSNEGYMQREDNQLTEVITVADGMVAGEDFPAGTYRVYDQTPEGVYSGGLRTLVHKYDSSYDDERVENIIFTEKSGEYQNLILKEGDVLVKLNCDIVLEPAEYEISELVRMW